jgi:hypothetical protein
MSVDLAQMHYWIVDVLDRNRPIDESMSALIDQCEKSRPHPDWSTLRELQYSNLQPMLKWIQTPFWKEPPAFKMKGLWFGLFNPCPDGRSPVADIYVCGSGDLWPTRKTTAGPSDRIGGQRLVMLVRRYWPTFIELRMQKVRRVQRNRLALVMTPNIRCVWGMGHLLSKNYWAESIPR